MTDTSKYLAVSADCTARYFGYEGAAGHALMIPSGFQGDPLAADTGIIRLCGGTADVRRLVEKFSGDKHCKRCEAKVTDELINAGEYDLNRDEYEEAARTVQADNASDSEPTTDTADDDTSDDTAPVKAKPVTDNTGIKCAIKGTDKVRPLPGTDSDDVNGVCPECRTFAKLTGKGFIGSHRINNEPTPPTVGLKTAVLPALVTDTATKREREAYTTTGKGKSKTVTANVPTAPNAGDAKGQREHGMMDGPALLPRGTYANGVRPDTTVTREPIAGGKYGTKTTREVGALSRSQQRKYWRQVAKRRNG